MLYQLSYSRGNVWWSEITAKNRILNRGETQEFNPGFGGHVVRSVMTTPPLAPATTRLVGLLLMVSGGLLGLGLLLKLAVGTYSWYTNGIQTPSFLLLSVNLLGLLGSGLLMRWGLRMRRGSGLFRDPNANEIL